MKTFEIIVHGKVQGVWYRKYTQQKAQNIGVVGWVKNQENGTVKIIAQATDDKLNHFVDWCKVGSPKSVVNQVVVKELTVIIDLVEFEIKK